MPLKGLGRPEPETADDVKTLRNYLEQFSGVAILDGREVTGTVPAGSTFVRIRHALGRSYRGGWVVGCSTADPFSVQTPEQAQATGTDVKELVVVYTAAAIPGDAIVKVWVY
jgi:hypothetical protein